MLVWIIKKAEHWRIDASYCGTCILKTNKKKQKQKQQKKTFSKWDSQRNRHILFSTLMPTENVCFFQM